MLTFEGLEETQGEEGSRQLPGCFVDGVLRLWSTAEKEGGGVAIRLGEREREEEEELLLLSSSSSSLYSFKGRNQKSNCHAF